MNEERHVTGHLPANSQSVSGPEHRGLTILLSVILAIGLLIYTVCLFKHISYPLMWADESMTAVGAQRVLEYGYPKVHDGRNVFYDLRHTDMTLGIDKRTDAYIGGAGWGHYYFAAPFVALSRFVSDLYLKTAMLRVPFALAGLAGLLLLLWTGTRSLEGRLNRLAVAALVVVLELPSVTLMLHLREVRYYSLQLLLTSVALCVFAAYHLFSSISYRLYAVAVFSLIPLLFLTFSPAAAAFCVTVGLYLGAEWVASLVRRWLGNPATPRHGLRAQLKSLVPVLASLALVAPLAWFFRTLYISRRLEEFYNFSLDRYLEHLNVVWGYFARYDIVVFAVAAKLLLALFWRRLRKDGRLLPPFRVSLLLSIYVVAQALLVCKIPNPLFTRYFIMLQPLLVLSFALDLLILARITLGMSARWRTACATVMALLLAGSVGWAFSQNRQLIRERLYEISHQYQGVLDFAIPYLRERYERPDRLVIATNYEETSYMYYLGCRVIVGFLNPDLQQNLEQTLMERPDCIIYRKWWAKFTNRNIFAELLKRGDYEMVTFPVLDYGFNNIPETVHWTRKHGWERSLHLYGTAIADYPQDQVTLFVRRGDAGQQPLGAPAKKEQ
jgi:hypothetical protein